MGDSERRTILRYISILYKRILIYMYYMNYINTSRSNKYIPKEHKFPLYHPKWVTVGSQRTV